MNPEELRIYCLAKPDVSEAFPFDNNTLVFKVGGKMFALVGLNKYEFINLKCDPERAVLLREEYEGVKPGYHMNKQHWNSVNLDGSVPIPLVKELIDHSYDLVFSSLSKKLQQEIRERNK